MAQNGREINPPLSPEQEVAELRRQNRQLEQDLVRAHRLATLGTLAGSVAHEFNNILTPILSYAQLALASPEDHELASKALRKSVEGTERAAKIASSMLGFIREDEHNATACIREIVQDTLGCLARDPAKDGVRIVIDASSSLQVAMAPVALQQVLLNLILNAIEAIKPAQGTIEITAQADDRSTWNTSSSTKREVEIRVSDSGPGIPPEIRERLFEPLVSGPSAEGSRQGTGLGLSICRRLVNGAQGTIDVESEPGRGAMFIIRLPAAQEVSESAQRAA